MYLVHKKCPLYSHIFWYTIISGMSLVVCTHNELTPSTIHTIRNLCSLYTVHCSVVVQAKCVYFQCDTLSFKNICSILLSWQIALSVHDMFKCLSFHTSVMRDITDNSHGMIAVFFIFHDQHV